MCTLILYFFQPAKWRHLQVTGNRKHIIPLTTIIHHICSNTLSPPASSSDKNEVHFVQKPCSSYVMELLFATQGGENNIVFGRKEWGRQQIVENPLGFHLLGLKPLQRLDR